MARRTKSGKWKARGGGTYSTKRAAVRAQRRRKVGPTARKGKRTAHRRKMRGRRR